MQPQPMIAVSDVAASSRWYQTLLGAEIEVRGGDSYARLAYDGLPILQLHAWEGDEHPYLGDREGRSYGNGVALWFATPEFDAAIERARALEASILEGPYLNSRARQRECWFRDPDGYVVVLASLPGDL